MEQNTNLNTPQDPQEDEGIDFVALFKTIWASRKTVFIATGIGAALGLLSALTMTRTYTVTSTLVPQMSSRSTASLGSLAVLAGFDIGAASSSQDLSPLVYPQIVQSVPFCLEMMNTPLHFEKADTAVTMLEYARDYAKSSVMGTIRQYTIGLPGLIIGKIRGESPEITIPSDSTVVVVDDSPKPIVLTKEEAGMVKSIQSCINLTVEKKEGYLTMTVVGIEPVQTAELAMKAQQTLQDIITQFRTEKAQAELDYVQGRYNEIKAECESLQYYLATITDKNQSLATTRSKLEHTRVQSKYNTTNAIYMEMAKQLEQAKMKVKKETPSFAIVKPVTVPTHPSNSRIKKLAIWIFLGLLVGCSIPLVKQGWPEWKEKFFGNSEDDNE